MAVTITKIDKPKKGRPPVKVNKPTVLTRRWKIGGNHPGFLKCDKCGVAGYMTELTLTKKLVQGLKEANFQIVSIAKPGEREGNINIMLRPLMNLLRDKGIMVR